MRKISLTPLGTLVSDTRAGTETNRYRLERGISAFPSVGDAAHLPTAEQLRSIIEASSKEDRRVKIGTSPLAANAAVTVDPDKLFGRHLAILGNTGSGKSCSVAGLIRWSLAQAKKAVSNKHRPNARFIILDANGEYSEAFADYEQVRRFQVTPKAENIEPLLLAAWMWNSEEWSAFGHAAPAVQRPILMQGLRDMRAGAALREPIETQIRRIIRGYSNILESRIAAGPQGYTGTREASNTGRLLSNIAEDAQNRSAELPTNSEIKAALEDLCTEAGTTADSRHWDGDRRRRDRGFNDFNETDIRRVLAKTSDILDRLQAPGGDSPISEDAPISFDVEALPDHLEQIASDSSVAQAAQFVGALTMRIRMMLADQRLGPIVNPERQSLTFEHWLESYIGKDKAQNGELAIIDLSLVPPDVLHVVIGVAARIVFEAIQRYRKLNNEELPTVLVLEEAHTFVRRGNDEELDTPTPSQMCRQTFERIAREGRKFGLGLVISSQRPSELSPTVLAQCNTFLLHRIVNDRDQELVGKLVPDNLGGLLKELPSLPSRQAILLGWAATVPLLVEITELPERQRPRSSDPKFWDVWTGKEKRSINWREIVNDWTGILSETDPHDPPDTPGTQQGPVERGEGTTE
jgi:DNA helicase HerA-like ATPase